MCSIEDETGTQQYLEGQEVLDRKPTCSLVDAWATLLFSLVFCTLSADSISGGPSLVSC